jgi:hypothetical protein
MQPVSKPTKQAVRDWMQERRVMKAPPATPAEIRRQLGWGLVRNTECAR